MFGIGHWELLIILVIVMIIFGAGKLPQIGGALGKTIKNFRDGVVDPGKKNQDKIETGQGKQPCDKSL